MSHCRTVIAVVLVVLALAAPSRGQEIKPLFYASMDEGKVDGKVGKAGAFKRVEARDKIDLDRGTMAFFVSFPKEIAISEWNILGGANANRNGGYWSMLLGFDIRKTDFNFNLYNVGRYSPPLHLQPNLGRWKAAEWHHLAAVWDRNEGVTVYEDGKKVASNWGTYRRNWSPLVNELFVTGNADEVYVFAEPLTDAQIAQLAAGQKPTGAPIPITDAAKRRETDLAAYGWTGPTLAALPVVEAGKPLAITFAHMTGAVDAKRPVAQVFEGFQDSTWPLDKYGAAIRGQRLDMRFADGVAYDRVRSFIHRPFDGQIVRETEKGAQTLIDVKAPAAAIWHAKLPEMVKDRSLVLTRKTGNFGQLDFYRAEPMTAPATATVSYLFAKAETLPANQTGLTLTAETPARFRNYATGTTAAAAAWTLDTPAFGGFQAVTEPPADAKAYDGAVVTLQVEGITEPTPVQIELKEPIHGRRNWIVAEAVLQPAGAGKQTYTIALKGRPVINMPPYQKQKYLKDGKYSDELIDVEGVPFGIKVTAANPIKWHLGSGGTTVAFTQTDQAKVLPLAVEDQVEFMRSGYSEVMEGHAYSDPMVELPLIWLCKFAPQHVKTRQMYWRIDGPKFFAGIDVPKLVRPEPTNDTGAPDWAFWQMQAMKEHLRVLNWRLNETQLVNGELGGIWNDDTDHVENWIGYILSMDDDGRIAQGMRKFLDGNWEHLDEGVGRYVQDSCHYYEEGVGAQSMRALFDYGDPLTMNRLLIANSHYDKWLAKTPNGRLGIVSEYVSLHENWLDREFNDPSMKGHRADMMVSAGYMVWYNHHPKIAEMIRNLDYGDDVPTPGAPQTKITSDLFLRRAYVEVTDPTHAKQQFAEAAVDGKLGPRATKVVNGYIDESGVTDEIRKAHFTEFSPPGPIAHYWGAHDTDLHWLRYRVSGDTRWMTESYKRVCEWFYSHDWLNTEAMPSMDRNPLPRYSLIRARIGSLAANRGASGLAWPRHAISYTKGANQVAVLFSENVEDRFAVRFYPFTDAEHEMQLRVWRLPPGTYTVTLSNDKNDDGQAEETLMTKQMELQRGAYVDLKLPPRRVSLLTVTPVKTGPFNFDRPDPAISADTVKNVYDEHLVVKVYNLGTKPAEKVLVRVRDGHSGQIVINGEQTIDKIEAPLDMKPKFRAVEFKNINANTLGSIIIEVDPEKTIDDLNPYNNRYELRY